MATWTPQASWVRASRSRIMAAAWAYSPRPRAISARWPRIRAALLACPSARYRASASALRGLRPGDVAMVVGGAANHLRSHGDPEQAARGPRQRQPLREPLGRLVVVPFGLRRRVPRMICAKADTSASPRAAARTSPSSASAVARASRRVCARTTRRGRASPPAGWVERHRAPPRVQATVRPSRKCPR